MSSLRQLSAEIDRFLSNASGEAMCIIGDWGIGKTYTWTFLLNSAKKSSAVARRSYAYVSLFGINSLEGLKLAIFENSDILSEARLSSDNTISDLIDTGNKFGKLLKMSRGVFSAVPGMAGILKEAGPLFFATIRDQIICIDDLERRGLGLSVRDVLGLTSFLKEQRGCKIVMLVNDRELEGVDKSEFDSNFEKVFDVSLRFIPTPAESARIAVVGDDKVAYKIKTCCERLGISNIRVIKKVERFCRQLETLIGGENSDLLDASIETLSLLCWCKFQPRQAPSLAFVTKVCDESFYPRQGAEGYTEDEIGWKCVLDRYGFHRMSSFDRVLLEGINVGFFDPDVITAATAAHRALKTSAGAKPLIHTAWSLFRDSFEDNTDHVVAAMRAAVMKTSDISINELEAIVVFLKDVDQRAAALELIDHYVDNSEQELSSEDLALTCPKHGITDPDIISACEVRFRHLPPDTDPRCILKRIGGGSSWSKQEICFLSALSNSAFCDIFMTARGDELRAIIAGARRLIRASSEQRDIQALAQNIHAALNLIGERSKLNARRIQSLIR